MHKAAESAAQAQREWAALPYDRRAAVLRRAGQLFVEHEDEIHDWLVRESGAIRPFAGFQTRAVAAEECCEAAALASTPTVSCCGRTSRGCRWRGALPVGVVGVIAPFNAPIILAIRAIAPALALGNAVVLKPDPRTAVCGGVVFARIFEEAGLPAGRVPHAARRRRRGRRDRRRPADPGHRLHRLHPRREDHRRGGGRAAQAGAPRARRELGADRARRRRPGEGGRRSGRSGRSTTPVRSAWRPAATSSPPRSPPTTCGAGRARRRDLPVGDPARGDVAIGPIIDERSATTSTAIVTDVGRRRCAPAPPAARYEGLFYRPTVLVGRAAERPGLRRGDLRPGRPGGRVLATWTRPSRWPTAPSTGCRWASSPAT